MDLQDELGKTWFDMKQVSNICGIKIDGKLVGRNELFKILRQNRILQEGNNLPFKKYVYLEYFLVKKGTVQRQKQYNKETLKTLVSLKGIEFIKQILTNKNV